MYCFANCSPASELSGGPDVPRPFGLELEDIAATVHGHLNAVFSIGLGKIEQELIGRGQATGCIDGPCRGPQGEDLVRGLGLNLEQRAGGIQ
ncbi:MAG: hypothetical protein QM757_20435 [Paludibaculum sp.]